MASVGTMIVTKKTLNSLGSRMNESAGSQVSSFARKQMEKFGWTEGKGLGKNEDGICKHVKITKREVNSGLGSEDKPTDPETDHWWHDAFSSALKKISKKKKRKRSNEDSDEESSKPPSYDELFAATGGARLGMRARADQSGKLQRTSDEALDKQHTKKKLKKETEALPDDDKKTDKDSGRKEIESSEKSTKKEKKSKKTKKEKKQKKMGKK